MWGSVAGAVAQEEDMDLASVNEELAEIDGYRRGISSEHCSKLKQFDLLRFWLLVVCSCCPRMLVRSQLVSLLAAISGAEHKFGDQVIDL